MANTGKARKTGITKSDSIDGKPPVVTTYSMLSGPPAGTLTPSGWNPIQESTIRRMPAEQYLSAFRSFMGTVGVPALQQEQFITQAEYEDLNGCPLPEPEPAYREVVDVQVDFQTYQQMSSACANIDLEVNFRPVYTLTGQIESNLEVFWDAAGTQRLPDGWYLRSDNFVFEVLGNLTGEVFMSCW